MQRQRRASSASPRRSHSRAKRTAFPPFALCPAGRRRSSEASSTPTRCVAGGRRWALGVPTAQSRGKGAAESSWALLLSATGPERMSAAGGSGRAHCLACRQPQRAADRPELFRSLRRMHGTTTARFTLCSRTKQRQHVSRRCAEEERKPPFFNKRGHDRCNPNLNATEQQGGAYSCAQRGGSAKSWATPRWPALLARSMGRFPERDWMVGFALKPVTRGA